MKNVNDRLIQIWNKPYMNNMPVLKERGFVFCNNEFQKDILITGINPSYRVGNEEPKQLGFDFDQLICSENKYDRYYSPIKKMLLSDDGKIDFRNKCAYLDIFCFRETSQENLRKKIIEENNIDFLIDQIELTQDIIEQTIKPKLLIIKNKESAAYFGVLAPKCIWMGYDVEYLKDIVNMVENETFKVGELYRINGLLDSAERINKNSILKTNLVGTLILVVPHINQYLKREKRLTPIQIQNILKDLK